MYLVAVTRLAFAPHCDLFRLPEQTLILVVAAVYIQETKERKRFV